MFSFKFFPLSCPKQTPPYKAPPRSSSKKFVSQVPDLPYRVNWEFSPYLTVLLPLSFPLTTTRVKYLPALGTSLLLGSLKYLPPPSYHFHFCPTLKLPPRESVSRFDARGLFSYDLLPRKTSSQLTTRLPLNSVLSLTVSVFFFASVRLTFLRRF